MGALSARRKLGCHEVCGSKIRFKGCRILVLGILLWDSIAEFESFGLLPSWRKVKSMPQSMRCTCDT
jgi:hypothetical protein